MHINKVILGNESGFVLVISMFILVILTIIGIAATSTTQIELQIAGNDKAIREAFHYADGGVENAIEMLEQNLICPLGFSGAPAGFDSDDAATFFPFGGIDIFDNNFAYDALKGDLAGAPDNTVNMNLIPSDTMRTLRIPNDATPANRADDALPHTNIAAYGVTVYGSGSAIQMAAGYEGIGKAAASGGGTIVYEIHSQHVGRNNSQATLGVQWIHIISGLVGCLY